MLLFTVISFFVEAAHIITLFTGPSHKKSFTSTERIIQN